MGDSASDWRICLRPLDGQILASVSRAFGLLLRPAPSRGGTGSWSPGKGDTPRSPGRPRGLPAWVSGSSVKGGLDLPASPTAPWDGLDLPASPTAPWERARVPGRPGMGIGPPGRGVLFKKFSKSWDEVLPVWNC